MHFLAEKIILEGLLKYGLVKGDLEEMIKARVMWYFMPHGLGHYIGLYTHDLPGLKSKENDWTPTENMYLRFHRKLEENMVCTNEPGVYFIEKMLKKAYNDPLVGKYLQREVIEEY